MQYNIVMADTAPRLVQKMERWLTVAEDGWGLWQPLGGAVFADGHWAQAVVRERCVS